MSGHGARAVEVLATVPDTQPLGGHYPAAWLLARSVQAFAHVNLGQFAAAAAVAEGIHATCARQGETCLRSYADYLHALAALGLGQAQEAASHARTALDGKHRLHDSLGIALATDLLASAAVACGRAEHAARLLGLAQQIWHTVGTPQIGSPELTAARTACEEQTRRQLGDDAYNTAFQAGYDNDAETGIAYALSTA